MIINAHDASGLPNSSPIRTSQHSAPAALYLSETAEELPQHLLCDAAVKASLRKTIGSTARWKNMEKTDIGGIFPHIALICPYIGLTHPYMYISYVCIYI